MIDFSSVYKKANDEIALSDSEKDRLADKILSWRKPDKKRLNIGVLCGTAAALVALICALFLFLPRLRNQKTWSVEYLKPGDEFILQSDMCSYVPPNATMFRKGCKAAVLCTVLNTKEIKITYREYDIKDRIFYPSIYFSLVECRVDEVLIQEDNFVSSGSTIFLIWPDSTYNIDHTEKVYTGGKYIFFLESRLSETDFGHDQTSEEIEEAFLSLGDSDITFITFSPQCMLFYKTDGGFQYAFPPNEFVVNELFNGKCFFTLSELRSTLDALYHGALPEG